MSYDSMEDPSMVLWIASLRASHANPIPSPANARERRTNAGCGPASPESSESAAPLSLPLKTSPDSCGTPIAHLQNRNWKSSQMSLLEEWEPFSGIWPKWGFVSHGECYELPKWAPAMGGRESSYWPTSRAEDSEATGANRGNLDTLTTRTEQWRTPDAPKAGGVRTRTSSQENGHQFTIAEQAEQWSTPNAHDATGARGTGFMLTDHHHSPHDLAMESEQWQTPATDSFRSRGGDCKDEMGLDQQARFWPSPQAKDGKSGETIQEYGNARPLNEIVTQWKTPHGLTCSSETGDPGGGGEFAKQATAFSLPAPQTPAGLPFWQRVRILLRLCRLLEQRLPSPYNKVRFMAKKRLNADFTDWLMGWPVGWSSVERAFSAAEMESYRSRQHAYLRFLLKG